MSDSPLIRHADLTSDIIETMSTALFHSEKFLQHDTGVNHPEKAERMRAIVERLHRAHLWDRLVHLPFEPAGLEWVTRIHDAKYVERVKHQCQSGRPFVDVPDCMVCDMSFDIALLAAGAGMAAADAVMGGKVANAFCVVRPPGHHAEREQAMGFCLLNNIAITAEYLLKKHGLSRVAIVDFDVHHGNGTQHIFEERADVFFISMHEHPSHQYPGTGFAWETGKGAGKGFTMNLPMQPDDGDTVLRELVTTRIVPALREFKPEFLLLSAGFDASEHDPLGHIKFTADGFLWLTRQLKATAEDVCHGRLVSMLEGGYDLRSLAECVSLHVGALLEPSGHDGMAAMKAGLY